MIEHVQGTCSYFIVPIHNKNDKNSRKEVVCMAGFLTDVSQIVAFIGVMAFIVSVVTEVLKRWEWFDKRVPTALAVIILSLILCPACMLGLAAYCGAVISWFMVFASFMAAFIVALVSMDGWERVTEIAGRFIRK